MFATVQFPQDTKEASVKVLIPLQAIVKNADRNMTQVFSSKT